MTQDEVNFAVGHAHQERQRLAKKVECLRYRWRTYGRAYAELADSPFEQEHRDRADQALDLRDDWKVLKLSLQRIEELNKLLEWDNRP